MYTKVEREVKKQEKKETSDAVVDDFEGDIPEELMETS